jgi:thymidylate synthase
MRIVESANEAWMHIIMDLNDGGRECSPRGLKIKEVENYSICIKNPKKRIITNPLRRMSLPYAFGELLWYLSARNDVAMMEYYSKRMRNFSDDGKTLNSAYGYRIFGKHPMLPFNQWENVVELLTKDPDSRQAIIHLHTPNNKPTKDEVCTLTLQFLIRNNKLDMVVNMRSNDVIWGFTYDVFSFTSFQELMANELGIKVGKYYHNAASMHIYEKDFKYLKTVPALYELMHMFSKYDIEFDYGSMTTMDCWELQNIIEYEETVRIISFPEQVCMQQYKSPAFMVMQDILYKFKAHKMHQVVKFRYDNIFDCMLRNQFAMEPLSASALLIVDGCEAVGKTTLCKKLQGDFDYVHFDKPNKNFNPMVYFNLVLSAGNRIFDRSFYSEYVYSRHFNRDPIISDKEFWALEYMLEYRKATVLFIVAGEGEEQRIVEHLDETDSHVFTLQDIKSINEGFEYVADYGSALEINKMVKKW